VYKDQNGSRFRGIMWDLAHTMSTMMNFTLNMKEESMYGEFINGSWHGVVGALQRGDADLTISDFSITQERSLVRKTIRFY